MSESILKAFVVLPCPTLVRHWSPENHPESMHWIRGPFFCSCLSQVPPHMPVTKVAFCFFSYLFPPARKATGFLWVSHPGFQGKNQEKKNTTKIQCQLLLQIFDTPQQSDCLFLLLRILGSLVVVFCLSFIAVICRRVGLERAHTAMQEVTSSCCFFFSPNTISWRSFQVSI